MFKALVPLSNVIGWSVPSGTANTAHTVTCHIQPGPRFHKILITGAAGASGAAHTMSTLIGDIRVIVNDEVVRLHSAAELNALNVLYGPQYAAVNGAYSHATVVSNFQLPIFLAEPWRKNDMVGEKLAWNTRFVRNMKIEVDIKAATFTDAVPLSFQAEVDEAPLDSDAPGVMGLIKRVDRTTYNFAAGVNDFMLLPRSGIYQEINFGHASDFTQFEVLRGKERIIGPVTLAQLNAALVQKDMEPLYRAATSPAVTTIGGTQHAGTRGLTDLVFDIDDRLDSGFIPDPSKEFNLRVTCTAGGNRTVHYQRLAAL